MRILLIDDEVLSREAVAEFLKEQLGHLVTQSSSAQEALNLFIAEPFPVVLSGVRMPGMSGMDLLKNIREMPQGQRCVVILFTAYADTKTAVEALRLGVSDLLNKPLDVEELAESLQRALEKQNGNISIGSAREADRSADLEANNAPQPAGKFYHDSYAEIPGLGRVGIFSDALKAVVTMTLRLHQDRSIPVLIEGETGTGKEIIARLVHHGEGESSDPFVSINCSAISPGLFESELFGYEGGAFTGAKRSGIIGKLELAQGGSLFLDEIGDMPLEMQPKLLRALQEKEIYRVGGLKKIPLNVRIIAATNRNLKKIVEDGVFRQDLYQRLNLGWINVPPLRKQKEAIVPLAQMFLNQYAETLHKRFRFIHRDAQKILENYSWPGNVRELQNTIDRGVLLYDDVELKPEHVNFLIRGQDFIYDAGSSATLKPGSITLPPEGLDLTTLEAEIVRKALLKFDGNRTHAARYLGLTRSALRSRLNKVN
jgi:two-component system, NtrC family, response regulator AtoC